MSSLRFDQYGSGDSEGDFFDSSFDDWIVTTTALTDHYLNKGYQIALLGQSMGGATAIAVAGDLGPSIASVVAWVPDPSVDDVVIEGIFDEEGGQRVRVEYWQEAHDADIVARFKMITAPTLVFLATNDEYVSLRNRQALVEARQPHQEIRILEGWTHSSWSYDQANEMIDASIRFLLHNFEP